MSTPNPIGFEATGAAAIERAARLCAPPTREQAAQDLADYGRAMARLGGHMTCVRIEQKYGLHGYPPELVSVGLRAAADGLDAEEAVYDYFGEQA